MSASPADRRVTIVGIDCASDPRNVGLALGHHANGRTRLLQARLAGRGVSIAGIVAGWIAGAPRALLALDAPLGWPAALGEALIHHAAGQGIAAEPNELFRRLTDRVIKQRIGRQPLDVGADRIARTAHAALALLAALRRLTGLPIPLAWSCRLEQPVSAIEVYPAGTLQARGLPASAYKEPGQRARRRRILTGLGRHLGLPRDRTALLDRADALDAAICVLAAGDFLSGAVIAPTDRAQARKEGWIWVWDRGTAA